MTVACTHEVALPLAIGPILKTRTFERAAPTAADPREKLLSDPWRRRGSEAQKTLRVVITYRGVAPPWGAASTALTAQWKRRALWVS